MNRTKLQDDYINELIEGMDISDLCSIVQDYLCGEFDSYTDEELKTEVLETYPHLLDEEVVDDE